MYELCQWRWQIYTLVVSWICSWSVSAMAQPNREWAISLSPQLGYVSAATHFQGTITAPGQFTAIDANGNVRGASLGFAAAITHRSWWHDNQTALSPVLAFTYGNASDAAGRLQVSSTRQESAARRFSEQLRTQLTRYALQGGVGLTMLGGLFELRLLFGGEAVDSISPEFDEPTRSTTAALAATLGGRIRLPLTEKWVGLLGASCGRSMYPTMPGGLTACNGEFGLEWVLRR